jgi:CMP-N-acetylneuraminic acid synthetase
MFDDVKIIIPARRNSKGLPFKNRKLFNTTIEMIPEELRGLVIVSTDDEWIIDECRTLKLKFDKRSPELAEDNTSTLVVMMDLYKRRVIVDDDVIVMLYLTYPERTWLNVSGCLAMFKHKNLRSVLGKKKIKGTHPYLYMFDIGNNQGKQLVQHDLYRRQDYPEVFEISHFLCIFNGYEVNNICPTLNNNLYGKHTVFYDIDDVVDVDTQDDLNQYLKK